MKIPHIDKASGYTDAQVLYCRTFPDWELDLENYPKYLFGPSLFGIWHFAPDHIFSAAVESRTPLTVADLLRARFLQDGKWVVGRQSFDTMEAMLKGVDWSSRFRI